jgi:hypothetical protein
MNTTWNGHPKSTVEEFRASLLPSNSAIPRDAQAMLHANSHKTISRFFSQSHAYLTVQTSEKCRGNRF